jgi:hypothetical protein
VTTSSLSSLQARRIVEARLGREPQDMLESAVALEAWAGVDAAEALEHGREMMARASSAPKRSAGRLPGTPEQRGIAIEALSFVIVVVAIACWAAPLSDRLGAGVVERALIIALPATLTLQWGLASRYLSRPEGLANLGRRPLLLLLPAVALVAVPAALFGRSGALAGLLTLTWTGGTIVIRRRWSLAYAGMVVLASAAMVAGLPATNVLSTTAALTTVGVGLALRARIVPAGHPPGRWGRTIAAALIGCGVGVLLVADRSVDWSLGALPAIALIPSSVASFWGGYHLWAFQQAIPQTLSGVALADRSAARGLHRAPLRVLFGAVARVVGLTTALSLILLAGAAALGQHTTGQTVLVAFGLVALATLFAGLLESVGRGPWAILALAAGVAGEVLADRFAVIGPIAGGGLIVGASIAIAIALPVAVTMLCRPATTLATALGIR